MRIYAILLPGIALFLSACSDNGFEFAPAKAIPVHLPMANQQVNRIAFGSCLNPTRSTLIFKNILDLHPDLLLMTGDNVYPQPKQEDPTLKGLKNGYAKLSDSEHFEKLVESVPVMLTWDDHDYGSQDAGGDWSYKIASQKLFNYVWSVNDERSTRDGVYYSRITGNGTSKVQVIVLDTRYFRTPLTRSKKKLPNGRYIESSDPDQTILGNTQWQWLESELSRPATIRIIVSSIQLLATGHNWESWGLMPQEKQRFFDLIKKTRASGVIVISGDRHKAGIYKDQSRVGYPLWEITSSSLNVPMTSFVKNPKPEPGPNRLGAMYYDSNFGIIDFDWDRHEVILQIRDQHSEVVKIAKVPIDELQYR